MSDNKERNKFYQASVKLLAGKFLKTVENKESEISKLHEGYEKMFEVWSDKVLSDKKMAEDIWREIIKQVMKKNGR